MASSPRAPRPLYLKGKFGFPERKALQKIEALQSVDVFKLFVDKRRLSVDTIPPL
jgi:hypothetical protein